MHAGLANESPRPWNKLGTMRETLLDDAAKGSGVVNIDFSDGNRRPSP